VLVSMVAVSKGLDVTGRAGGKARFQPSMHGR
jgi:hypothetical protein